METSFKMDRNSYVQQIIPIVDTAGQQIKNSEGEILCQILENGVETISFIDQKLFEENLDQESDGKQDVSQDLTQDENVSNIQSPLIKIEWGDEDTRLLLDIYSSQLVNVGPLKKFRKKKDLWNHISLEIERILKLQRSATQCQTRYKTVLKRKTEQDTQNKTSGQVRCPVNFEDEINKIKAIDDSVEPEVLLSADNIEINNKIKDKGSRSITSKGAVLTKKKKVEKGDLLNFFHEMHCEKEANKERRHQEKLKLLKELFKNDNNKNDEYNEDD